MVNFYSETRVNYKAISDSYGDILKLRSINKPLASTQVCAISNVKNFRYRLRHHP